MRHQTLADPLYFFLSKLPPCRICTVSEPGRVNVWSNGIFLLSLVSQLCHTIQNRDVSHAVLLFLLAPAWLARCFGGIRLSSLCVAIRLNKLAQFLGDHTVSTLGTNLFPLWGFRTSGDWVTWQMRQMMQKNWKPRVVPFPMHGLLTSPHRRSLQLKHLQDVLPQDLARKPCGAWSVGRCGPS